MMLILCSGAECSIGRSKKLTWGVNKGPIEGHPQKIEATVQIAVDLFTRWVVGTEPSWLPPARRHFSFVGEFL
jgi:hypothetical protein